MNNRYSIDPATLPSVALTARDTLPPCSGVYVALSEQGQILYIGKAQNICERWKNHHRMYELAQLGCTAIAWHACSIDHLDTWESTLIHALQPVLNNVRIASLDLPPLVKVTINLDETLWQAFKIACVEDHISASRRLTQLIREYLQWRVPLDPEGMRALNAALHQHVAQAVREHLGQPPMRGAPHSTPEKEP